MRSSTRGSVSSFCVSYCTSSALAFRRCWLALAAEPIRHPGVLCCFGRHCRRYVIDALVLLDVIATSLTKAENIVSQFSLDVQLAEARAFYSFQSMIEQVHSETYSLLIETYVRDNEEKDYLFKGMETSECKHPRASPWQGDRRLTISVPAVRKKADWALKYITPELVRRIGLSLFSWTVNGLREAP